MQIEVNYEKQTAVVRNVHGGREEPERGLPEDTVVFCGIFPHRSKRPAMRKRHIVKLFVRRDCDAVRTVNIYRHISGLQVVIDSRAFWAKPDERNLVGGFRQNVDEIVLIRFRLRPGLTEIYGADNDQSQSESAESLKVFWEQVLVSQPDPVESPFHQFHRSPLAPRRIFGTRESELHCDFAGSVSD